MRELFLCLLLVSCGGAVEDAPPSPSAGTNAPRNTTVGDGCTRACDRMTKTCAVFEDPGCASGCEALLDSAEKADRYASCIESLSCADLQRGAMMNYGPIGECWTRAQRDQ